MAQLTFFLRTRAGSLMVALLVVAGMFVPAFIFGAVAGDDLRFHVSWFASYKQALLHGEWYPRWLPDQMAGMGSPTLYFYPPFATFFLGLLDVLTLHHLPETRVVAVAAFLMAGLSGCTFYLWARRFSGGAAAVYLSAFYAVAPYHVLIDYYTRAALAEYAAYIWVPLIFAGIHRVIVDGGRSAVLMLVAGIVGLFCTHLLSAMIIGPFALCYALVLLAHVDAAPGRSRARRLGLLALAGACGIGLAAFYVAPAILLLKQSNAHALNLYPVYNTKLFRGLFKPGATVMLRMSVIAATYFLIAAGLSAAYWRARRRADAGWRDGGPVLFWTATILLLTLLMAGACGFVFRPPSPFEQIQFLWRMVMFLEFAVLSLALCVWQREGGAPMVAMFAAPALALLLWQSYLLANCFDFAARARIDFMQTMPIKNRLSPSEYFPNGTSFTRNTGEIVARLAPHLAAPLAYLAYGDGRILGASDDRATFQVELQADTDAQVVLRQFYFPGWQALDDSGRELAVTPAGADKLASFMVGPGRHRVTVTRMVTRAEWSGMALSGAALLALIAMLLMLGRGSGRGRPR